MRKGQYLAIESVLSVTLGIALAMGTVTMFNNYKDGVLSTGETKQVDVVEAEVLSAVYTLREVESGQITVDLPENIAGNDYQVTFEDKMRVDTTNNNYSKKFHGLDQSYDFTGSVTGGPVTIFKRNNNFTLRAGQ